MRFLPGRTTCLLRLCLTAVALALLAGRPPSAWAGSCELAIAEAERRYALPPGLLLAIGRVEALHRGRIHPFAVNAGGRAHYPATDEEARALVLALQRGGARNLDRGCVQVSSRWHGLAFLDAGQAFDPASNARYGAAHLRALWLETGDWMVAAGRYHNPSDAARQRAYRCRVQSEMEALGIPLPGRRATCAIAESRSATRHGR